MTTAPRHALALALAPVLAALLAIPGPAQGNGRDADVGGSAGPLPWGPGMRLLAPGLPLQVQVSSPLGTLNGLPYFVAADLQSGPGAPVLALPGEPGVLGIGAGLVPVANGFAAGTAGLPPGGLWMALDAPAAPPGTRLVFQAAVADAAAPNGLAITPLVGGDTPDTTTIVPVFQPTNPTAQFGYALTIADMNGDGIADVLAGAREAHGTTPNNAGRAYLFHGSATVPAAILDDPSPQAFSHFGGGVGAGDFNGDGFPDIVVGARQYDTGGQQDAGKVVVYYGPAFAATAQITPPVPEFRGQFGHWMSCGDFDGDGFCDLAVSSIGASSAGLLTAGRVDLFFGPSLAPTTPIFDPVPVGGDRFGYRMEARDLDRDGFCDLAIGSPFKSLLPGGTDDSGAVSIHRGPFLGTWVYFPNPAPSPNGLLGDDLACADFDADGDLDVVAGSELDNSGGLTDQGSVVILHGPAFATWSRIYALAPVQGGGFGSGVDVGDFNHDDVPDLMVGEFWYPAPFFRAGRAHVRLGPDFLQGITVSEPVPGSSNEFGRRIRAGDLDGDGDSEMVVGVPFSSANGVSRSGALYLVSF